MLLTKEQILATDDRKRETLHISEWGGDILLQEMSGKQRDRLDLLIASRMDKKTGQMLSTKDLRAKMVILSVVNEDGTPMFTDKEVSDLSEKSGQVLDKIVEAVQKLNGLSSEDIEEAEKN